MKYVLAIAMMGMIGSMAFRLSGGENNLPLKGVERAKVPSAPESDLEIEPAEVIE